MAKKGQAGSWREKRRGVYEFRIYLGKDIVTGEDIRRSTTWHGTKRELGDEFAKWVSDMKRDEAPPTEASMGWLVEKYLELLKLEGRSPTTLRGYRSKISTWINPNIGSASIADFSAGDLRELEAKMAANGCAVSTIRQVHAIVQGALRFAVEKDYTDRNVAMLFKRPKQERTTVIPATIEEADALYRAAGLPGSDLATAIALGSMFGRREGELAALRWSDVQPRKRIVRIWRSAYVDDGGDGVGLKDTKSHAETDYPLTRIAVARLRERRNWQRSRASRYGVELVEDPFVLSRNADGSGPPRPDGYSSSFGRIRDKLKMPHLHFHSLRHFAATYLLDAGVDPVTAAKLLGHADATMILRIYAHGTDQAARKAADKLARHVGSATAQRYELAASADTEGSE